MIAWDDPRYAPMKLRREPAKPTRCSKRMTLSDDLDLDPAVRVVLETALGRNDLSWVKLEANADLGTSTLRYWAYGNGGGGGGKDGRGPGICLVRRALRALGLDLTVVPWQEDPDEPPIVRAPVAVASGWTS